MLLISKMTTCIVQADDRVSTGTKLPPMQTDDRNTVIARSSLREDIKDLMRVTAERCDSQPDESCRYFLYGKEFADETERSPYWIKVEAVRHTLMDKRCKNVLWLDGDATVNINPDISLTASLEQRMGPNATMLISADSHGDADTLSRDRQWSFLSHLLPFSSPFNAGVFALRNGDRAREIVDFWLDSDAHDSWSRNSDGEWKCKTKTLGVSHRCKWAGSQYEQGDFVHRVMPRYNDHIMRGAACDMMNTGGKSCQSTAMGPHMSLACHFYGQRLKDDIGDYLKRSEGLAVPVC